jgi:hypothetical protein
VTRDPECARNNCLLRGWIRSRTERTRARKGGLS